MGYYQDRDEDFYADQEASRDVLQHEQDMLALRYHNAAGVPLGGTFHCVTCGKPHAKRHPSQKFCPPDKKRRSPCKDRYHNITNPRGMFAHLGR